MNLIKKLINFVHEKPFLENVCFSKIFRTTTIININD